MKEQRNVGDVSVKLVNQAFHYPNACILLISNLFLLKVKIELPPKPCIFTLAVPLYEKIARDFGCSKNKIRKTLMKAGIELRENRAQATNHRGLKRGKQSARPYYGFCYFEGEIVKDPREFPTLQLIHRRWKVQKTIHQITLELNSSKLPSRSGKQWSWAAVQNLVARFETKKVILHTGGKYEFR